MGQEKCGSKKCCVLKVWGSRNLGPKILVQTFLGRNDFRFKKNLVLENKGEKILIDPKNSTNLGSKKCGYEKNVVYKKDWVPTNFLFQKSLGQSLSKKIKALKILA